MNEEGSEMARRMERPAIVSDEVDEFIGHLLAGLAGILVASVVIIQMYRWFVR